MDAIVIHFEPSVQEGNSQRVSAQIEGVADEPYRLWYEVPSDHLVTPIAKAHAFLISVINQAMATGRDVVVDAPIPRGLAVNLQEYQHVWCTWHPKRFQLIKVHPAKLVEDEPFRPDRGAIMSFSGGLDSSFSAKCLADESELAATVVIGGLDVRLGKTKQWAGVICGVGELSHSLSRPLLIARTNWEKVAPRLPGYMGYFAPTVAVPILLSHHYGYAAVPSAYSYDRLTFPLETNPITDPLLGRVGFPVRHHGAWARRIHKVAFIASWPEAVVHLRPCDAITRYGTACGRCRKCIQTALTFCSLGYPAPAALGGKIPSRRAIARFQMTPYARIGLQDAVTAARDRGIEESWVAIVARKLKASETTVGRKLDEVRRRLTNVAESRTVKRLSRRVKGKWTRLKADWLTSTRVDTALPASPPLWAISRSGYRMYVDRDDLRGAALVINQGETYPITSRIWRHLLQSGPWSHIIDVGANYGEMIIDLEIDEATQVIALEPNPYVRCHLEKSIREAGLPINVIPWAISDKVGTIEFNVDRTWSGMSSIKLHPRDTLGHRIEKIQVQATTLISLLEGGATSSEKRVLIKIDVEGNECDVLRGLGGIEKTFADFAALVEIRHLSESDFAALISNYVVELFDEVNNALVTVPDTPSDQPFAFLYNSGLYSHDAVLRARRRPNPAQMPGPSNC